MSVPCTYLDEIRDVTPKTPNGCEECLQIGDTWVHLRLCLICGHVGCCDSSKNKHATRHFHATDHPIVQSFEPGEDWLWCYVDEVAFVVEDFPSVELPVVRDRRPIKRFVGLPEGPWAPHPTTESFRSVALGNRARMRV